MITTHTAATRITVDAYLEEVWESLLDPAAIKQYMFGAEVESDWVAGAPITWKGEWEGQPFEDRGVLLRVEPPHILSYSHFSPSSGLADTPENHHIVTMSLDEQGGRTQITVLQDGDSSSEERRRSEENWSMMLESLREYLEDAATTTSRKV